MGKPSFEIRGLDGVTAALDAVSKKYPNRLVRKGLLVVGEQIMTSIKDGNRVPFLHGHLRDSGFVDQPTKDTVRLAFGGAASDYAVVQHENMDFKHKAGGPKFLEQPLLEQADSIAPRVAAICKLGTEDTKK